MLVFVFFLQLRIGPDLCTMQYMMLVLRVKYSADVFI